MVGSAAWKSRACSAVYGRCLAASFSARISQIQACFGMSRSRERLLIVEADQFSRGQHSLKLVERSPEFLYCRLRPDHRTCPMLDRAPEAD
ncbi:MAG: hypothetical protein CL820_17595 [Croceicoccus sp.]|nr:hypothetical protein [Croceicoccus sp.]MAL27667.1 hypothetical protein [Croceicoccus sp.]